MKKKINKTSLTWTNQDRRHSIVLSKYQQQKTVQHPQRAGNQTSEPERRISLVEAQYSQTQTKAYNPPSG